MTVEELIKELLKIEDKSKVVHVPILGSWDLEITEEVEERENKVVIY